MPFFTFEKHATSLNDLEIVRKIVEREGCLEALEQLLVSKNNKQSWSAAPLVLQTLIDQLRVVSVQIVECIEKWKETNGTHVFQWRQRNYLLKMTHDTDFLASAACHIPALESLRMHRNPFLAPLHLDHAALLESTCEIALLLGHWVGNVDMKRVFYASQVLRRELEQDKLYKSTNAEAKESGPLDDGTNFNSRSKRTNSTMTIVVPSALAASKQHAIVSTTPIRARWNHQPITEPETLTSPHPLHLSSSTQLLPQSAESQGPLEAMQQDITLAKELITHAELEVGALREELAVLQEKLTDVVLPEKRRHLQNRIGTVNNNLKFRSGDLYQRKNELKRKEAVFRLARERRCGLNRATLATSSSGELTRSLSYLPSAGYTPVLETVLQEDEIRRHEIVQKFSLLAKMNSSTSRQKNKHVVKRQTPAAVSVSSSQLRVPGSPLLLDQMTPDDVHAFIDALQLGDSFGAAFRARGIDGALLAQATDQDLEELGISIRLHRVRILEAVERTKQMNQS